VVKNQAVALAQSPSPSLRAIYSYSLLALDILGGGGGNILGGGSLGCGCLLLVSALGLDLLLLALLDLLLGSLELLLALLGLLTLSSQDLVETHTNDGLLDAGGLPALALGNLISLDLLVEASPGLSPGELHCLLALVEEGSNLAREEVVDLAVLRSELFASTGVDSVLRE